MRVVEFLVYVVDSVAVQRLRELASAVMDMKLIAPAAVDENSLQRFEIPPILLDHVDRVVGELQLRALELRTTPLLRIVEPLPRMARDVAQRGDETVADAEIPPAGRRSGRAFLMMSNVS